MRRLSGKRVLVTGGAGFIGSHLVERLVGEGAGHLVVVDDFSLGKPANLAPAKEAFGNLKVHQANAADYDSMQAIVSTERIDVLFNLAVVPLPASLERPRWTVDTNVAIATVACELARRGAFETLIHFSSSEVYGSAEYVPMDEDHPLRPQTPYAASKAAGDHIVLSYGHTFGIDASIVRPFNTIGPRQNERAYAGVIPLFTRQALTGQPITIDGDGEQTRDFVYVEHVAAGAVRAYEEDDTRGRVVNVATGHETSINCLAVGILELTHSTAPVHHGPPRPGDVRRHCGSTALMSTLLGLDTRTPLERSLGTTIEWYRSQLGRDD